MEDTLHPFDFEICKLPQQSAESMLGIEIHPELTAPPQDFFHNRLGFGESPPEIDLYDISEETGTLKSKAPQWNDEELYSNQPSRKQSSRIASVLLLDIISGIGSFSGLPADREETIKEAPEIDNSDDKRKVTDKWGFVVEDPAEVSNNPTRNNSRAQNKLEEKWLDILRDWGSYSDEKKRRIGKK